MGEQAVLLARAVNYRSAGTVEFIVDKDRNFYFLEMNTRLQVEHPVTEMVTGLDLVELMIRINAGEKLPLGQKDIKTKGWAIEARIYAEDPARNFLPSIGRLSSYLPPAQSNTVRIDTGVIEGSEISIHYDPMIAKLITHGRDRKTAIKHMRTALDSFFIRGIKQNLCFLNAILGHKDFCAGSINTNFIAEHYADGFDPKNLLPKDPTPFILVATVLYNIHKIRANKLSGKFSGSCRDPENDWVILLEGREHNVHIELQDNRHLMRYDGKDYVVMTDWQTGQPLLFCTINEQPLTFQVERSGIWTTVSHKGHQNDLLVLTKFAAGLYRHMPKKQDRDTGNFHLSPMPGLVLKLSVSEGQDIKAGEELAIVEAMKMENVLTAERDATIAKILVAQGESVSVDQPLIEFEES